jgi:hypothetical protein
LSHHCTPRSARQSHRFRLTARYSIFSDICLIHHHLACSLRMRLNVAGHALGTSLWLRRLSTDGVVDSRVPRTCYRWEQTVSSGDHPHWRALSLSRLRHTAKTQPRSPTLGFRVFQGGLHSSTSTCKRPLASATSPSSGKSPADHNLAKNLFRPSLSTIAAFSR